MEHERATTTRTKRIVLVAATGLACLGIWLLTLRINGNFVLTYLRLFVLNDDGRYLLAAATTLVCLNTLRAIFLYIGWFNLGESLGYSSRRWRGLSWLVPLISIPCSYAFLSGVQGVALHFGIPALFSISTVIVMHLTTQEIQGWTSRSLVIMLLVFAFQWLDLAPSLTRWGFGGGELSMAVKHLAVLGEWNWVLDGLAFGLFFTTCIGGFAAAALLVGANNRDIQFAKIRTRDREIAALREEAIRVRGYHETRQLVHDLKRPLTTILGLADVMTATLQPSPALRYAEQIAKAGASMNQMVEELLKEDARHEITVTSLMEYVGSQVSAFAWRHTVTVVCGEGVGGLRFRANRAWLSRALINLLDNARLAVQNNTEQKVTLSAAREGKSVFFTVRDNGCGFSDHTGLTGWGVSGWGSTGIGLAFVEEVVKNHNGSLHIGNHPEGGAEVCITLPLA